MIKPGDKVRVVKNRANGKHPIENRLLVAGDIITVKRIGIGDVFFYYCSKGLNEEDSMFISDVVKEEFKFIISRNKP